MTNSDDLQLHLQDNRWRDTHLGRLLGLASSRFDARVLALMAQNPDLPLNLSNLARRNQVSAAHIKLTRHLPIKGARLVDLAMSAEMTKQAMGDLVEQCAAWGMLEKEPDARDARAKIIRFTDIGLLWLQSFKDAVQQAQSEFEAEVGAEVATVVLLGLESYAALYSPK